MLLNHNKSWVSSISRSLVALTLVIMAFGNLGLVQTRAAGVNVVLSPSTMTVSSATTVTLTFTTTAPVPVNGTIQVYRPTAGYTGTAALAVSAGAIGATTNTVSGSDTLSTATVSTQIPAGALTITVSGLSTSATAANNSFKIYTSAGDYGGAFQYVGLANVVTVRARVLSTLSFAIRNNTDTGDTNICDMGDLIVSAIGACEYRLKVATNAANGYTINVTTSGNFTNGAYPFANAAVGSGGTGGTAQVAGTELYGAIITKGSITSIGGTTVLAALYNAGASNVSYVNTASATLLTANKPNSPVASDTTNTTLVRHEAAISNATPAGIYQQTVTYTVSPSF